MPNPRRRHGRMRQAKRRTHFKLVADSLVPCEQCGASKRPHRICPECGTYKKTAYKQGSEKAPAV